MAKTASGMSLGGYTADLTMNVNVDGKEKLKSLQDGITAIVSDRRFQDYWKTQEELIEQVGKAFERFQSDSRSHSYAEDLVKNVNALKAVSGQDLSGLFDNAQQIQSAFNKASEAIGATADAFSYEKFRDVFGVFEEWQKSGKDVASIMDNLQNAIQNVSQTKALADANMELERLKNELAEANDTIQRLGDTSQVAVLTDQINDLNGQIDAIRNKAKGEVLDFLKANDIAEWDARVQDALNNVTSGYTTAKEAIAEIRAEFSEVFQATKDGGFDSSQVAQFSAKLDDIIARVAEIKTAIASGDFSGLKEMNDDMSRGAQLSGEEKGAIEGLSESTRALGESATGTSASFSSLLDVIKEIGNVGPNTLTSFSIAMQSAAKVGGDKFNAKQVVNLAEALNALGQVKNITGIASLSALKFEGLKELKVSKAALSNLAEFLPKIGQANIERIKALSELDFTNLSNLKVSKSSVETIKEFTDAVNSLRELGAALDDISPKLDQINTAAAQALGRDLNTAADAAQQTAAAVGQMNAEMNAKSGNSVLTALEGIPGLTDDAMLRMAGSIDRATVGVKEIKANLVETNDGAQNMVNLMVKGQNALGQSVQYLFRYNQEIGEIDSKLVSISQKFDQVKNSTEAASSAQKSSKDMTEEESQALDRQKASLKEIEQIQRTISTSYGKTQGALTNSLDLFNDSGQMVLEKQHRIDELRSKYLELTEAIEAYKRSGASATPEEADRIRTLQTEIQRLINTNQEYLRGVEEKANAEKNAAQAEADSANETVKRTNALRDAQVTLNSMQRTLLKTSYGSKEYSNLQGYITSLTDLKTQFDQGKITLDEFRTGLSNMKKDFAEVKGQIESTGASVGVLRTKFAQFMRSFTMMFSAARIGMMVFRELREMVSSSIEIDASMRQLEIVTHASSAAMRQFGDDVADAAKRVGASITDMVDSATVFARIGFTLPDSQKLAEFTTMLQNVGDIDVADAQDAITSIVKAFDFGAGDIEGVMDKLIVVGNNFPISVSQIAEGMTNASSTLNAAGNTFEQSVALLTAANVTLQNAAKASTGLRTIAARIRNTKVELDELGETMTTAKYEQAVNILTSYQVRLTDINGEYRSTYDIMSDIATQWGRMTSMEQAALATTLAGTRQQDVFYSLINQFQEARGAMDAMKDSAGALTESYSTYMDSVQAHINQFNAARQQLSTNLMESGVLRDVVDIGTGLIEMLNAIDQIVDKIGGLKTVIVAILGSVVAIKSHVMAMSFRKHIDSLKAIVSLVREARATGAGFRDTVGAIAPNVHMVQLAWAAVALAVTIATAAILGYKRHVEEVRQAQHKAAEEAAQSVDTINSLYNEYMQMNEAQENGTATTEELAKAQDNLIDALGLTKGRVQELTDQYGNLTSAMQIAAAEAMNERQRELQGGVQAYMEELRGQVSRGAERSVHVGWGNGSDFIDLMSDPEFGEYFEYVLDSVAYIGRINLGRADSIDEIIEQYKKLGEIMDFVSDSVGADNDIWRSLNATYTEMGNVIGPMLKEINELNEAVVMEHVYRTNAEQGMPLDQKSFELYRESLIGMVEADAQFNALGGSAEDVVDSVLRADAAFVQFYGDVTGTDGTGGIGNVTQTVGDLAESVKNMAAAYKALESAKADMADGGGISAETLSALAGITEDYMDYLYVENGVLKLNVDLWEQMAHVNMQSNLDAIAEEQQHIAERKAKILSEIEKLNGELEDYEGQQPDTQALDDELYDIDATTAEYTQRIARITALENQIATLNTQLYNEESDLKRNEIIKQIEETQRELAIIRQDDAYWDQQILALAERREEIQKELDLIRGTNPEAYDAQDEEAEQHKAEIQAQIDADEAALEAIAEREEELLRMREIYRATLNEEPQTQAGQAMDEFATNIGTAKSAMDALASAEKDMADGGGLTASTIKTLAGITDNYTDYLYEENGVIKLNIEAWREYAAAALQGRIDMLNAQLETLKTERDTMLAMPEGKRGGMFPDRSLEETDAEIQETTDAIGLYQAALNGLTADTKEATDELATMTGALGDMSDAYDILATAEEEMQNGGSLSLNTIKALAGVTDEYIRFLKVENGVITLNTEAWKAYARERQQAYLDGLEQRRAELEAQRQELQSQLNGETPATMSAEELATAIAEVDASIEGLDNEKAVYESVMEAIANGSDEAAKTVKKLSTALSDYKQATSLIETANEEMQNGGISFDTLQSLMNATDDYIQFLYRENGQLKLNTEAYEEYARARAEESFADNDEYKQLEERNKWLERQIEYERNQIDWLEQNGHTDWSSYGIDQELLAGYEQELAANNERMAIFDDMLNLITGDADQTSGAITGLTDAVSGLNDGLDILLQARREMRTEGGVSMETIRQMAQLTDDYIDYLYEENGVIKLNTEAWAEFATGGMQSDIEKTQARIEELQARQAEIIGQLEQTDGSMDTTGIRTWNDAAGEAIDVIDRLSDGRALEALHRNIDEVWNVGNVDLFNRQVLHGVDMLKAGYEEFEGFEDDIVTLYSQTFGAGGDGADFDWKQNVTIDITPIDADGHILAPGEVEDYIQSTLLNGANSIDDILANDERGLVMRVTPVVQMDGESVDEMWERAWADSDAWAIAAHALSAAITAEQSGAEELGGSITGYLRNCVEAGVEDSGIVDDMLNEVMTVINAIASGIDDSDIATKLTETSEHVSALRDGTDESFDDMSVDAEQLRDELTEINGQIEAETNKLAIYSTLYMDTVNSAIDAMDPYQEVLDGFSSVADTINSVTDAMQTLSDIQDAVADGFIMSLDEALKFAEVYPEILNNATVAADGQIALDEGVVNAFIANKQAELQAQIDADIAELESQKAVVQAKLQLAQAELQIAQSAANGTTIDQQIAMARIEMMNNEVDAVVQAGQNEADAYAAAAEAMSGNLDQVNTIAADTATEIDTNLSTAISNAATNMYSNAANIVEAINGIILGAHEAGKAINAMSQGKVEGSTVSARGSGGTGSAKTYTANTGKFSKTEYTYSANPIEFKDVITDLQGQIEGYEKTISQLDGQISALQALRGQVLGGGGGKSSGRGGGGGGKGGGGGGGGKDDASNWFEEQYKLHQHLLAMDAEEVEDYLEWLNDAYKRAYEEGIIDLDSFYKYEEEVYKGLHDLFKDYLNDVEHEIEMRGNYNENGKMISLYRELIAAVEKEISAAREQGLDDTDDYIQELQDKWWSYTDAIKKIEDDLNNQAKSATDKLVDYRLKMLKQEISDEKDAIKERLNNLKAFYDEQKRLLKDARDEEKYLEEQAEKRKAVADIEAQLAQLSYDNSAWAQKKRLELEEELSNARKELDDFERDHAIEVAEEELDKLYELQKKELDSQTDLLDAQQKDAKALYEQALEDIRNGSVELYEEMIDWNNLYGDGIEDTIKTAWEEAYKALEDYKNLYGELWDDFNLANATGYSPDGGGWDSSVISGTNPANIPVRTTPPTETTQDTTSAKTYPYGKVSSTSGNLSNGSRGEGVKALQYALNELGFGNSGTQSLDGVFGSGTANAVRAFQKAMGISADGIVGPATKKKFAEQGYASGTRYATSGLHLIDELGSETIFESADGKRYKLFTGGEKVLNARASEFLYDFAMNGGEILTKIVDMALEGARPGFEPNVIHNEITMGDIIINGRADQSTVSELRRAQREAVDTMLKEFSRLGR